MHEGWIDEADAFYVYEYESKTTYKCVRVYVYSATCSLQRYRYACNYCIAISLLCGFATVAISCWSLQWFRLEWWNRFQKHFFSNACSQWFDCAFDFEKPESNQPFLHRGRMVCRISSNLRQFVSSTHCAISDWWCSVRGVSCGQQCR